MRGLAILMVLAAACREPKPPEGLERGDCKADKSCEGGLICLSNTCVRPPGGDCSKVAESLASVKLGNYAEKSERTKLVADLRAQCDAAELSVDEATCLTSAKSKYEMSKCPKPILPELQDLAKDKGGCKAVGARMEDMAKSEMSKNPNDPMNKMLPDLIQAVITSCDEDAWPADVKDCLLAASPSDSRAANTCLEKMPHDVQEKFMKRMEGILEKAMQETPPPAMPPPGPGSAPPIAQ